MLAFLFGDWRPQRFEADEPRVWRRMVEQPAKFPVPQPCCERQVARARVPSLVNTRARPSRLARFLERMLTKFDVDSLTCNCYHEAGHAVAAAHLGIPLD